MKISNNRLYWCNSPFLVFHNSHLISLVLSLPVLPLETHSTHISIRHTGRTHTQRHGVCFNGSDLWWRSGCHYAPYKTTPFELSAVSKYNFPLPQPLPPIIPTPHSLSYSCVSSPERLCDRRVTNSVRYCLGSKKQQQEQQQQPGTLGTLRIPRKLCVRVRFSRGSNK